jgi:integrase
MVSVKIKYVVEDTDRHGNIRLYYRRKGQPKLRLPGPKGSQEFFKAYHAAKDGLILQSPKVSLKTKHDKDSIRWLCVQYFGSADFKRLDPRTQRVRRGILERFCQTGNDGEKPYKLLQARHIRKRRDAKADKPESANGMIKALRQLFKYATEYDLMDHNPARDVTYMKNNSQGFHSWTLEEIHKFEARHEIGSMARLALALALYTGQRRADIVAFGPQHIKDGWLTFTQFKNRNNNPVHMEIPVIPTLQKIIEATPCGTTSFLLTAYGKPFTSNGFGNKMRDWCDQAGLPNCSTHGLRKAAAARLAEMGRSEHEIMAITGHRTSYEVIRYTRAASQKLRAKRAMKDFEYGSES